MENKAGETFEGVTFDSTIDWDGLVVEQLRSGTHRGRNDLAPGDWLMRAWHTLAAANKQKLEEAIYGALEHQEETVRSGALRVIDGGLGKPQFVRLLPLAEAQLKGDEVGSANKFGADLIRLASGASGVKAKAFRRKVALHKVHGSRVLAATVKHDVAWVLDNAAGLVDPLIDPDGKRLAVLVFNLFRHHRESLGQFVTVLKDDDELNARLGSVIDEEVSDDAMKERLLKLL